GHLVNDQAVIVLGVIHLWKISGKHLLVRTFNEIRLPNSIVVSDVLNVILFQKMIHLPRVPALEQGYVKFITLSRIVTGSPGVVRPSIKHAASGHEDRMINKPVC